MSKFAYAALVGAGMSLVVSVSASAQVTAAATPGGDVTAEEATPLPPVIVESPSEPVVRKQAKGKQPSTASATGAPPATAGEQTGDDLGVPGIGIYTLGQLDMVGGSTITNEAMWTFNKQSLDQAVSIVPGVTLNKVSSFRNESNIFVRGFDRFRVPLSIDGVRLYLPADNRIDFARFLTPDLSEIQIEKGYVSVLNGASGLGGAINMVSRKPTKAVDIEGRVGLVTGGDISNLNSWNAYAFAGTKQDKYYAQLSGNIIDQDHFSMSDDFVPLNPANEDGGDRNHSNFQDWRINAKFGYTPNATDEYAINYTNQNGSKSAPIHVSGEVLQGPRYWEWPDWDTSSLSWMSKTQLTPDSYLKTTAFYNTFYNLLKTYDDATYTTQNNSSGSGNPGSFDSPYDDKSYGAEIEYGMKIVPMDDIKAAIHYRRDIHTEGDLLTPTSATAFQEPEQENIEDTWSFAIENTLHATRRLDFVTGVSYDLLEVYKATTYTNNALIEQETPDFDAWNYQGALIYSYSDTGKAHISISDRARFATVFERYSTRFGTTAPNPNLSPERATNYEVGVADVPMRTVKASANVFYNDLTDSIQYVTYSGKKSSFENVGGEYYGFELSLDWEVMPSLKVGGNYTYLERHLDFTDPAFRPDGTPRHEAFLYLAWNPTRELTITPSLELASDRYSMVTSIKPPSGDPADYILTGSYTLLNIDAQYEIAKGTTLALGAMNLLDDNYSLVEGFPEPGRQFYASARTRF